MEIEIRTPLDKQIEFIMNEFNFARIEQAMQQMDWKWGHKDSLTFSCPDIDRIKECARHLLELVSKTTIDHSVSTGGFIASRRDNYLRLAFEIESAAEKSW